MVANKILIKKDLKNLNNTNNRNDDCVHKVA